MLPPGGTPGVKFRIARGTDRWSTKRTRGTRVLGGRWWLNLIKLEKNARTLRPSRLWSAPFSVRIHIPNALYASTCCATFLKLHRLSRSASSRPKLNVPFPFRCPAPRCQKTVPLFAIFGPAL